MSVDICRSVDWGSVDWGSVPKGSVPMFLSVLGTKKREITTLHPYSLNLSKTLKKHRAKSPHSTPIPSAKPSKNHRCSMILLREITTLHPYSLSKTVKKASFFNQKAIVVQWFWANFQATPRGLKSVAPGVVKKHPMKLDQASRKHQGVILNPPWD